MTSKIRDADYVFCALADQGADHIFLVDGGCAMYLNNGLGRNPLLHYVCNHKALGRIPAQTSTHVQYVR